MRVWTHAPSPVYGLIFQGPKRNQTPQRQAQGIPSLSPYLVPTAYVNANFSHFPKTGNRKFKSQENTVTSQITFEGLDK